MGSVVSRRLNSGGGVVTKSIQRRMSSGDCIVEATLCKAEDIPDNSLRSFDVGDGKVLLVKSKGDITAIGPKCSHYGAPLEKGSLAGDRVRCPWHGACFNVKTGDIEDFPGLQSIPSYDVKVEDGMVKVRAHKELLKTNKFEKPVAKLDKKNEDTYVVVGAGAAGSKAIETIRQQGFTGRLIFAGKENNMPYDRVKCSKMMDKTASDLGMRTEEFYKNNDIEIMFGETLKTISTEDKSLTFESGRQLNFTKLLLATGGVPRLLNVPGGSLDGVFVLRTVEDSNAIAAAAKGKHVVVIGTSFIGMEAATYLVQTGNSESVTVLGNSKMPFERSLGEEIGARIQELFEEKGVKIVNNAKVERLEGEDGAVTKVVLSSGEEYPCSVVVAGIGVVPSTTYLEGSNIEADRGYIKVNEHMETSVPGIFCAGDIALFPLYPHGGTVAIGHWQLAQAHGHVAALNMTGNDSKMLNVPVFWSMLFGKNFSYTGHGAYDKIIISGDLSQLAFVAYYCQDSKVVAVSSSGRLPAVAHYANYLQQGKFLTKEEVENDPDIIDKLVF